MVLVGCASVGLRPTARLERRADGVSRPPKRPTHAPAHRSPLAAHLDHLRHMAAGRRAWFRQPRPHAHGRINNPQPNQNALRSQHASAAAQGSGSHEGQARFSSARAGGNAFAAVPRNGHPSKLAALNHSDHASAHSSVGWRAWRSRPRDTVARFQSLDVGPNRPAAHGGRNRVPNEKSKARRSSPQCVT